MVPLVYSFLHCLVAQSLGKEHLYLVLLDIQVEEQQLVMHLQFGRSCQNVNLNVISQVNSLYAGLLFMLLMSSADFFLNLIFQTILRNYDSVKRFGSRSGSRSGSKLFAKITNIQQKSQLARKA